MSHCELMGLVGPATREESPYSGTSGKQHKSDLAVERDGMVTGCGAKQGINAMRSRRDEGSVTTNKSAG